MTHGNYRPDDSPTFSTAPQHDGAVPGTLGVRFAARLIDGFLIGILISAVLFGLNLYGNAWIPGLLSGLLVFGYYIAFEVTQGWTPGKKILGLRVLGAHGAPKPTARESAIRNAFLLVSIVPFIGGLLALIAYVVVAVTINSSPTKQGKHDELAGGTQVIRQS